MREVGRLRFMVAAVAASSLTLVVAARWAGRLAGGHLGPDRRSLPGATTTHAGTLDQTPDLSFYRTLGAAPAPGRRAGAGAAEPILRPAPGDGAPAGTAYVVQALATRDEAQARRLRDRLAARGLPATVVEDDSGETPIYRVRIGRWRERGPAEALAGRLREKERLDPWVLQEAAP